MAFSELDFVNSGGGIDVTAASFPETNPFTVAGYGTKTINFNGTPKLIKIIEYFTHTSNSKYLNVIVGDITKVIYTRFVDNALNTNELFYDWGEVGTPMAAFSISPTSLTINLTGTGVSRNYIVTVWY